MTLPAERWNGIWSPTPMRLLVDAMSQLLIQMTAARPNQWASIDASLLPLLAWQHAANAYDPTGTEPARREAIARAREVHVLGGTELAYDLLLLINQTVGRLDYVGDYDSAGRLVPRLAAAPHLPQGTHSRHGADPNVEDTTRDSEGRPTGNPNPAFNWDGTVYRKFVHIILVLPVGREPNPLLFRVLGEAAQRVLPFTLEVVSVTVETPITLQLALRARTVAWNMEWV